ncbi:unnamed protein product [Protopolystoma xenopodis]|uniref:Uncharacterized protein n=1 Tax=Protopolystoma xenopodis TaxID=117903 RepID=A0A448WMT5_9PLAT|nr:unnamed protein product [Protopolystoma xenopodis]
MRQNVHVNLPVPHCQPARGLLPIILSRLHGSLQLRRQETWPTALRLAAMLIRIWPSPTFETPLKQVKLEQAEQEADGDEKMKSLEVNDDEQIKLSVDSERTVNKLLVPRLLPDAIVTLLRFIGQLRDSLAVLEEGTGEATKSGIKDLHLDLVAEEADRVVLVALESWGLEPVLHQALPLEPLLQQL